MSISVCKTVSNSPELRPISRQSCLLVEHFEQGNCRNSGRESLTIHDEVNANGQVSRVAATGEAAAAFFPKRNDQTEL
jgi:hypothetical protein